MKKLIALHAIQFAVAGVMTEVQAGGPLVLTDEMQINHLMTAQAVREPTDAELKKLFNDDTVKSDGKPVDLSPDLAKMSKAQLITHGETLGIQLDQSSTKPELIAEINRHTSPIDPAVGAGDLNDDESL